MAIVGWPEDVPALDRVQCAVCKQEVSLRDVSAGLYGADGEQAFACNSHFMDMGRLILGWADFAATQPYSVGAEDIAKGGAHDFPIY